MKIIYIAIVNIPSKYASSVHIANMVEQMAEIGHNVLLFNPNIEHNTNVIKLADYYKVKPVFKLSKPFLRKRTFSRWSFLNYPFKLIKLFFDCLQIHALNPDLIYIRDQALSEFAQVVITLNKPFILEAHLPNKNIYLDMLLASKKLKKFVVISHSLKLEYTRLYPNIAEKIEVHHDAAKLVSAIEIYRSNDQFSPPLTSSNNCFVGGYIGNLYPGKCMEELSSFASLLGDQVDFVVFGGSTPEIEKWSHFLRESKTYNIQFAGYLPPSELPDKLHHIDFFIAPFSQLVTQGSDIDLTPWMSPLKIFEYMSLGRPIVCSDLPVIREVLIDGHNSLLCQPGNPSSWVTAILYLKNNREFASELAKRAYRDYINNYTWGARARRIIGISS